MWKLYYVASAKRVWGEKNVFNMQRGLWVVVWARGSASARAPSFTSPQTQSHWNMWFWSAHVRGWGQLKHQYTMITHFTAAMRTTCQIKPKRPDRSPGFQSCPVPWEPCSQACKQWLCIHSTFSRLCSFSQMCFIVILDYIGYGGYVV